MVKVTYKGVTILLLCVILAMSICLYRQHQALNAMEGRAKWAEDNWKYDLGTLKFRTEQRDSCQDEFLNYWLTHGMDSDEEKKEEKKGGPNG